jgi:phage terminase small subunit
MTPRQRQFVAEYLVDLNAKEAAIRAGFSPRTAAEKGYQLLQRPDVKEHLEKAFKARERRTNITSDRVLEEIARIAFADVRELYRADGSMKKPNELSADTAAALAAVDVAEMGGDDAPLVTTKKAKLHDKVAALTLAARHLGMLNDKLKVEGETTVIVKDYTGRKR